MHIVGVNHSAVVQGERNVPKTYYYHLRKVRESVVESTPAIVPLNNRTVPSEKIEISDGEINIALPADMNIEALSEVIRVLKNAQ